MVTASALKAILKLLSLPFNLNVFLDSPQGYPSALYCFIIKLVSFRVNTTISYSSLVLGGYLITDTEKQSFRTFSFKIFRSSVLFVSNKLFWGRLGI